MPNIQSLIDRMTYWCRDANLGYDQSQRWDIRPGGESDCSSLVIHCLREAGFETGASTYTGNMSDELTARGWTRLPNNGHPKPGDILLNDRHHVAVYLGNGLLAQSSIDERGRATGGMSGDQTGRETNIRNYYNYPWDCYLRWEGDDMSAEDVWNFEINGVKARDRLIGIDQASNGTLNTLTGGNNEFKWLTDRVYRIANLLFNKKDNAGTGMVDGQGHDVERTLYDRIVWIDKRVRELNEQTTGTPEKILDLNKRLDTIEAKLDQLLATKGASNE